MRTSLVNQGRVVAQKINRRCPRWSLPSAGCVIPECEQLQMPHDSSIATASQLNTHIPGSNASTLLFQRYACTYDVLECYASPSSHEWPLRRLNVSM